MMKRSWMALLLVPCLVLGGVTTFAAEKKDKASEPKAKSEAKAKDEAKVKAEPKAKEETKAKAKSKMTNEERAKLVTEGELAQWLVRVLGLARFLPAAPTDLECFQILMQNNIKPADGWQADQTVTMASLARVIVQSLGRQAEVSDPEDDVSWLNFLRAEGIDIGTIGEAVENLEPLPQPVGPEAVVTSTDPLSKLQRINPPDNQQLGADLSTLGRIFSQVQLPGRLPPPMTPN